MVLPTKDPDVEGPLKSPFIIVVKKSTRGSFSGTYLAPSQFRYRIRLGERLQFPYTTGPTDSLTSGKSRPVDFVWETLKVEIEENYLVLEILRFR